MFSLISTIALYPPVKKGRQVCRPTSGNRLQLGLLNPLPPTATREQHVPLLRDLVVSVSVLTDLILKVLKQSKEKLHCDQW